MSEITPRLEEFVAYTKRLKGDEKGEAQVFLDRLFIAFGHAGYKEAGATLEDRVKAKGETTKFADLVWKPRLLLEMKSRGEKLESHYRQAFEYWLHLVPNRPRYVVLCNFDEFYIYDFDQQLDVPVDAVSVEELPIRYDSFNFLLPQERTPVFRNNRVEVTRAAADKVAKVFRQLVRRREDRDRAQRFILQCVVALFAEDIDLLPRGLFTQVLRECKQKREDTYDLIGLLFRQMNTREPARGGRFKEVPYFNGGLFSKIEPVELEDIDAYLLEEAAEEDWSKVNPAIFGTLFQASMDQKARHAFGAHFTSEADIMKIALPTIVRPWRERLAVAKSMNDLLSLHKQLSGFQVLDPACGSGNFLYCAYREMKRIEVDLLLRIREAARKGEKPKLRAQVSVRQMHGFDVIPFAVELSKVTLILAKELAIKEAQVRLSQEGAKAELDLDLALPLDNLDDNIRCADALFEPWPRVDAVIGNPPYQSKNKMQAEFGRAYLNRLHARFPEVPGRADYCVYFFRRAHDELQEGGRAGLVGTNTIRQNYSREGGLDHIVQSAGTITEAVSTQAWSGDAAVHVSIVNWVKGPAAGDKLLLHQAENGEWSKAILKEIPASLSSKADATEARTLLANADSKSCYQGITHGHEGFVLPRRDAEKLIAEDERLREVLFPYLTGDDLLSELGSRPPRYVIDFQQRDQLAAKRYDGVFQRVQKQVLPERKVAAEEETRRNKEALSEDPHARVNHHHANFLSRWWSSPMRAKTWSLPSTGSRVTLVVHA